MQHSKLINTMRILPHNSCLCIIILLFCLPLLCLVNKILLSLDTNNKMKLFEFIKAWMEDENIKHEDWMKSRLVPLPKKGDLHHLNN